MAFGTSLLDQNRLLNHGLVRRSPHYAVLERTQRRIVLQADPPHFQFKHFRGELPNTSVAFNANYFWSGLPIGLLISEGKKLVTFSVKGPRPIFFCTEKGEIGMTKEKTGVADWWTAFQAGPTLLWESQVVYPQSFEDEFFQADIARRTQHIGIGVTKAKKILLVGLRNGTLEELAGAFKEYHATHAMNLDGGSSCRLTYSEGRNNYYSYFGMSPATVGIALTER